MRHPVGLWGFCENNYRVESRRSLVACLNRKKK